MSQKKKQAQPKLQEKIGDAPFPRNRSHHRERNFKAVQDMVLKELALDAQQPSGDSRYNLGPQQIAQLNREFPVITSKDELPNLPSMLQKGKRGESNEFGLCPYFTGAFVDQSAQHGYFPMTLNVGVPLLAPKLHTDRSSTVIGTIVKKKIKVKKADPAPEEAGEENDNATPPSSQPSAADSPKNITVSTFQPTFDFARLCLPKNFLRQLEVRVHFHVKAGEQSMADLHRSLAMIRSQQSEDWLCKTLRSVVQHMMMDPHAYATNFYVLVVAEKYDAEENGGKNGVSPNPTERIIACDMGYLVGDIMTAFTGAFEVDGAGSVTLGASAKLLALLEIPLWDMGMQMEYKAKVLKATTRKRHQWLQTVKDRKEVAAKAVEAARTAAAAANQTKGLEGVEWYCPLQGDAANSRSKSNLLKDPRRQALLKTLSKGVAADVLMAATTAEDLFKALASRDAVKRGGGDKRPLVGIADNANNSTDGSADANGGGSTSSPAGSKSQQKKAAKAAQILAKKEAKKANGGQLPPKEVGTAAEERKKEEE